MKYTECPIDRPWFSRTFIESRAWRLGKEAEIKNVVSLSNGNLDDPGPEGNMIGYTTSVIFVKDVTILSSNMELEADKYNKTFNGKGGARYGIFYGGIKGSKSIQTSDVESTFDKEGLKITGMQVIGFRCRLLKKAPNPIEEKDGVVFV